MHLDDLLTVVALTAEVNKLPVAPGKLGAMGLFRDIGVRTTSIAIEFKNGVLQLVPDTPRTGNGVAATFAQRNVKTLSGAHLALNSVLLPTDVQDVRAFGEEAASDGLEAPAQVISERLSEMKAAVELTREWQRLGAVKGVVLDADGTTVINDLLGLFGITQTAANGGLVGFALDATGADVLAKAQAVRRQVEKKSGGLALKGVRAVCSPGFMDALLGHKSAREAYRLFQAQVDARAAFADPKAAALGNFSAGFTFGGVEFVEYIGSVSGVPLIAEGEAYAFPVADGAFATYNAPANYNEAVNTLGKAFYAKSEARALGKGYDIEVQSNPLTVCLYPEALVKLTATA